MIVDGQFSAEYSDDRQNLAVTNTLANLTISDADFTNAYWIGYINFDNLPSFAKLSRLSVADGTLTFSDVTRADNVDVLITSVISTNQNVDTQDYAGFAYFDSTKWTYFPTGSGTAPSQRFLNSYDVNTDAATAAQLYFAVSVDGVNGELIAIVSITPEELHNNSFSKTITSSNISTLRGSAPPSGISFDITESDIDGAIKDTTSGSYTIHYVCIGYKDIFARSIRTNGVRGSFYTSPMLSMMIYDDTDDAYVLSVTHPWAEPTWGTAYGILVHSSGAIRDNTYPRINDIYPGGVEGSVDTATIATVINSGQIAAGTGNIIVQGVTRDSLCMVRRSYVWDDIRRALSLKMRYGDSNTYDNAADKYYTHVTSENEFLCELVNGVTDFDKLRPWQIAGVTLTASTNRYTEDDRPPYIPGGGDDDEKIGDSIGFNANIPGGTASGLYTMYALRQAHVSNLGAALWSAINSPDGNFWQNLQMALGAYTETGSADISSVLEYIDAIRIYPFALVNLPGYAGAGTGAIKIGSGKTEISLSAGGAGNVGVMGSYTGIIDAGSVTIPAHYGDFRDYDGVSVSVYLPYIGNITLDAAEVTGQTLTARYAVDLTTGNAVCYLLLSGNWGYYPIGIYNGTIGADIPLTAAQGNRLFTRQLSGMIGKISGLTAGRAVPETVGAAMSAMSRLQSAANALTASALTPPTLAGGNSNFAGFGAPQTAYVQIRRHLYAYNAQTFPASHMGRRSYGVHTLGTLSSFTVCDAVDVSGIPAPADIQTDIKNALESGVYL